MTTYNVATVDFLVRAAREFRRGGWVFTGFHWPVLAGQLAYALDGEPFAQAFEAGATTHAAGRLVPTSTTDYPAYGNALGFVADSSSILLSMARRFDRVVLDASNVDVRGCVNSSYIGPRDRPVVRLPGGGGSADIAARARELIWLCGGEDLKRIQSRVEHVTAAPGPHTVVRLHTRWGIAVLGGGARLEEIADVDGVAEFVTHMEALGVENASPQRRRRIEESERRAAIAVLEAAANRGYHVAQRALKPIARRPS